MAALLIDRMERNILIFAAKDRRNCKKNFLKQTKVNYNGCTHKSALCSPIPPSPSSLQMYYTLMVHAHTTDVVALQGGEKHSHHTFFGWRNIPHRDRVPFVARSPCHPNVCVWRLILILSKFVLMSRIMIHLQIYESRSLLPPNSKFSRRLLPEVYFITKLFIPKYLQIPTT